MLTPGERDLLPGRDGQKPNDLCAMRDSQKITDRGGHVGYMGTMKVEGWQEEGETSITDTYQGPTALHDLPYSVVTTILRSYFFFRSKKPGSKGDQITQPKQ